MPSLEWNRKWGPMLAGFEPTADEPHWGDVWGDPEECPEYLEVRRRHLEPHLVPEIDILEIGAGGGRWTQYLLPCARRLVAVDLNPEAFDYLRRRFADHPRLDRLEFHRTDGFELAGVADATIDLVFTFDVFVHLEPDGIGWYLEEIERVLRPGGRAVVHYGDKRKPIAAENPGFSDMDRDKMDELLSATALKVLAHDDEVMFHSNVVVLER